MTFDVSHRFIFDQTDIRGDLVQLDTSYQEITEAHQYHPVVKRLLGEFLVAASLLSRTIKFEGRLILQAKTVGPLGTLMAEATHDGKIRGIARPNLNQGDTLSDDFESLFAGGTLAVTIEPEQGERYQSLVGLQGYSLAECLEYYFAQSEQLSTQICLAANDESAAGLLLQQLPRQLVTDATARESSWHHVKTFAATVKPEELFELEADVLLKRLYLQDDIKLFDVEDVLFCCSCSEERMAKALITLSAEELQSLFDDKEEVEIQCEFCQSAYLFTATSLAELVRGDKPVQ